MDKFILRAGRILIAAFAVFWLLFLMVPIVVTLVVSFTNSTYMTFPPPGYSLKWYESALNASWMWSTLANSVIIAVVSTIIAVVIGIAAARVLARKLKEAKAVYPEDRVSTIHSLIYTAVLDSKGNILPSGYYFYEARVRFARLNEEDEAELFKGYVYLFY